jgi:hypothetical protein
MTDLLLYYIELFKSTPLLTGCSGLFSTYQSGDFLGVMNVILEVGLYAVYEQCHMVNTFHVQQTASVTSGVSVCSLQSRLRGISEKSVSQVFEADHSPPSSAEVKE